MAKKYDEPVEETPVEVQPQAFCELIAEGDIAEGATIITNDQFHCHAAVEGETGWAFGLAPHDVKDGDQFEVLVTIQ